MFGLCTRTVNESKEAAGGKNKGRRSTGVIKGRVKKTLILPTLEHLNEGCRDTPRGVVRILVIGRSFVVVSIGLCHSARILPPDSN
jgi:hypothetical protein